MRSSHAPFRSSCLSFYYDRIRQTYQSICAMTYKKKAYNRKKGYMAVEAVYTFFAVDLFFTSLLVNKISSNAPM